MSFMDNNVGLDMLKRHRTDSVSSVESAVDDPRRSPSVHSTIHSQWEVDKILDWRYGRDGNGILEYKVLWRGYPMEHATWEIKEYLTNAREVLAEFVRSRNDVPNDLGDEPNEGMPTTMRLMTVEETRPVEDDPHVDWWLYDGDIVDEEEISELPEPSQPQTPQVIPSTQCLYMGQDAAPVNPLTYQINGQYVSFLESLCALSHTVMAKGHCLRGILAALRFLRNAQLQDELRTDAHSVHAYALIILVWLIVCLRIHNYERPDERPLVTLCSSLYLTSHGVLTRLYRVALTDLTATVQFWENLLKRRGAWKCWLKDPWYYDVPTEIRPENLPPRNQVAGEYLDTLETEGVVSLARLVLAKEQNGPQTSLRRMLQDNTVRKWLFGEPIKMFASMDACLLRACIEGRIPQLSERLADSGVYQSLRKTEQGKSTNPSTYANFLCDRAGMAPTPSQWKAVCKQMLVYILICSDEGNKLAAKVDQLIFPSRQWPVSFAARGLRRYTEWRHVLIYRRSGISHGCRSKIQYFVRQMLRRIHFEILAEREFVPFADAVVEIGFGIQAERRLTDHRHHRNSNYIMNLAQALFENLYPGMFVLRQCILYNCWRPSQPWLSEIALTQLCQGYTEQATGFSHYPAGHSNGSSFRKTPVKMWVRFEAKVLTDDRLRERLKKMHDDGKKHLQSVQGAVSPHLGTLDALKARTEWLDAAITVIQTMTAVRETQTKLLSLEDQCTGDD